MHCYALLFHYGWISLHSWHLTRSSESGPWLHTKRWACRGKRRPKREDGHLIKLQTVLDSQTRMKWDPDVHVQSCMYLYVCVCVWVCALITYHIHHLYRQKDNPSDVFVCAELYCRVCDAVRRSQSMSKWSVKSHRISQMRRNHETERHVIDMSSWSSSRSWITWLSRLRRQLCLAAHCQGHRLHQFLHQFYYL